MRNKDKFNFSYYGVLAKIYDFLDIFHYGNVCKRSRNALLDRLTYFPENPLIIGCGPGDFAEAFLKKYNPPCLTICDISDKMLAHARTKIKHSKWSGNLYEIHQDAMNLDVLNYYDFISINYLLNIFNPEDRIQFVKKVVGYLKPGGLLYIADFTTPKNGIILYWAKLNWYLLCVFFFLTTGSRIVKMGDLRNELLLANLKIIEERFFVGGMYGTFLLKNTML